MRITQCCLIRPYGNVHGSLVVLSIHIHFLQLHLVNVGLLLKPVPSCIFADMPMPAANSPMNAYVKRLAP